MKPSSRPPKTPFRLSDSVHRQLNMYALAATAAGVSALTLIPAAEGKIIYTKTNVDIFVQNGAFPLDLNHDKVTDFEFAGRYFNTCCILTTSVKIAPVRSKNAIWWDKKGNGAAALRAGALVGPKAPFSNTSLLMGLFSSTYFRDPGQVRPPSTNRYRGPWENGGKGVKNRYLGLKFEIRGKTHYGWARLNFPSPRLATLTGYAYETIPNKPIVTGETKGPDVIEIQSSSLGDLAAGASAIPAWRSEKQQRAHRTLLPFGGNP